MFRLFETIEIEKYLCRSGKKDETLQEYKKARWYIDKLIKYLEEQK